MSTGCKKLATNETWAPDILLPLSPAGTTALLRAGRGGRNDSIGEAIGHLAARERVSMRSL
jgi:hypothetical protein